MATSVRTTGQTSATAAAAGDMPNGGGLLLTSPTFFKATNNTGGCCSTPRPSPDVSRRHPHRLGNNNSRQGNNIDDELMLLGAGLGERHMTLPTNCGSSGGSGGGSLDAPAAAISSAATSGLLVNMPITHSSTPNRPLLFSNSHFFPRLNYFVLSIGKKSIPK